MTRTSKALKRLGVAGIAVATIGAGVPAFFGTAAIAATVTPTQITPNDCPPASSTTTATQGSNTCTTQAQVGTIKTLGFTESDANGNGAPGRTIDFTLSSTNSSGGTGDAIFPANQPTNGTSTTTTTSPTTAQCTTDANGSCSVNVTDDQIGTATVVANDRQTEATFNPTPPNGAPAQSPNAPFDCSQVLVASRAGCVSGTKENVQFRAQSVAPAELQDAGHIVVQPEGNSTSANPTPGRPEQVTYRVLDAGDTTTSPQTLPAPLAGQTVTLSLNHEAFFTPNCQASNATTGAPARNTADPNGSATLAPPSYFNCTFDPAPASGAQAGNLKNSGRTITVVTDRNGEFTVTIAEARDQAFDSNGVVPVTVTATVPGGSSAFDQTGANGSGSASDINFTTRTQGYARNADRSIPSSSYGPLNGASVKIQQFGKTPTGQQTFSDSGTVNIPNNQPSRLFVVELRDQFGNLTQTNSSDSATATSRGAAVLKKSGVGRISCYQNNCYGNSPQTTSNTDGTNTQQVAVFGTYVNDPEIFSTDALNPVNTSNTPEVGTQTLTATYNAQRSTFTFSTGTTPTVNGVDVTKYQTLSDVATINYYVQNAQDITFRTTPSNTVPAGTVVTVTANVKDQYGNAVSQTPVTFFRSGTSNNCTSTATNGTGTANGGAATTSDSGNAGFSFSCSDPSTQNVTVVVSDRNGGELARNTQVVTFTGTATQSPTATPSATSTATASPTAPASPTASASSSTGTTSPSPTRTSTTPAVTQLSLSTSTPDIQPNQQAILQANGSPNTVFELRCYTRPNTTYFTARSVATATGSVEFRLTPGENTRCFVRYSGSSDTSATNSSSVVINVHATLSLSAVRTSGTRNFIFQGRNLPRLAGQLITLYRVDNSGKEIRTANLKTDSSGIYRVSRHFTGTGTFTFVVRTSQTLNNAAGVSNPYRITIR